MNLGGRRELEMLFQDFSEPVALSQLQIKVMSICKLGRGSGAVRRVQHTGTGARALAQVCSSPLLNVALIKRCILLYINSEHVPINLRIVSLFNLPSLPPSLYLSLPNGLRDITLRCRPR